MHIFKLPHIKFSFICLLLFCLGTGAYAQSRHKQDVLYLRNGSIIRGTLRSPADSAVIKIETADHSLWAFSREEVDSLRTEKKLYVKPIMPEKGYYNVTDLGLAFGINTWGENVTSFTGSTVNGYSFNRFLSVGAMVGADMYETIMIPVALDVRGDILHRRLTPFYFVQAGYAWPADQPASGWTTVRLSPGRYLSGGLGIKINLSEDAALVLSMSYRQQKFTRTTSWQGGEVEEDFTFNRNVFKIGFMF